MLKSNTSNVYLQNSCAYYHMFQQRNHLHPSVTHHILFHFLHFPVENIKYLVGMVLSRARVLESSSDSVSNNVRRERWNSSCVSRNNARHSRLHRVVYQTVRACVAEKSRDLDLKLFPPHILRLTDPGLWDRIRRSECRDPVGLLGTP